MTDETAQKIRMTGPGEGNFYPAVANEVFFMVRAEDSGGNFELIEEVCKPGFVSRLHRHDTRSQTFYIVEGSAEFIVDGKSFNAKSGSSIHVPPGVPHKILSEGGMKMLMIYCQAGMEKLFAAVHALTPEEAKDPDITAALTRKHDTIMMDDASQGTVLG
jgi:mannose-6-phosphate isomerase-like protein (cupin superfamily)